MTKEAILDFINNQLEGDAYKADLSKVLPPAISAERFVAVLKNFIKSNARSKEMIEAIGNSAFSRNSLLQEALKCAADGLMPDGREASLNLSNRNVGTRESPVWEKAFQYMPMVQGITKTIHNSGLITNICTGVIHENDKYDIDVGTTPKVSHLPAPKERGERIYAFASVTLKGETTPMVEIMTAEDITSVASRSKSANNGPWKTDTSEMWRKSVLRRLSKRLPRSNAQAELLDKVLNHADEDTDLFVAPVTAPTEVVDETTGEVTTTMPKGLQKVAQAAEETTTEEIF